jgi:hypothetical protein
VCAASSRALLVLLCTFAGIARGDFPERAIDVPTRPGITERILLIEPPGATATVALYAGGNGGLHHEDDGCVACPFREVPWLMRRLKGAPRKSLLRITGGRDEGDPCGPFAHDGFNGQEHEVVFRIAGWIAAQ